MIDETEYEKKKKRAAAREQKVSREGREIGSIPEVVNRKRRASATRSLSYFLKTYFPLTVYLSLSDDHKEALRRIEKAVRGGGHFAFAMPRGSGKTTLTELSAIWAILTGKRRFVMLVGADKDAATDMLASIKTELETNDELAADFPEACYPIRCLEGEARRCAGQLCEGERTRITWQADELVMPRIDGTKCSESVIRVAGITGKIRGAKYKNADGETIRPDLAIVDDPQTEESAHSAKQCDAREQVIKRAIVKLAGPGKEVAVFMPCTVIRKGDLADRFLDKKQHSDWHGLRAKMLYSFPENMDLWEKYDEIRRAELEDGNEPESARQFYRDHLDEMRAGARVGWDERKYPQDVDALQHAMDLYFDDPAGFLAEYNNEPQEDLEDGQVKLVSSDDVILRTNGYSRGEVPAWATRLTAMIDVQQDCLFWMVCAWSDSFRGCIVDYGCFPDQGRSYFTKLDLRKTLRKTLKEKSYQAAIRKGLELLTKKLMANEYQSETGTVHQIERLVIDASYEQTLVYSFTRSYGDTRVTPYHGRYVGATSLPFSLFKAKPGEKIGHHWIKPSVRGQKLAVRHYVADVNFWKSFVHSRLSIELGVEGDLSLFGTRKEQRYHRMLADHLTAQYCIRAEARERKVDEWKRRPGRDHDWFDTLVGCAVMACVEGSTLKEWSRKKKRDDRGGSTGGPPKGNVSF